MLLIQRLYVTVFTCLLLGLVTCQDAGDIEPLFDGLQSQSQFLPIPAVPTESTSSGSAQLAFFDAVPESQSKKC